MNDSRNLHKSVMAKVRSLFQSPPVATSGSMSAYTVYGDSELRQVMSGALNVSNVYPRVFILEAYSRPAETVLPMAIIETTGTQQPFEVGNANGHVWDVMVHILARMTGERKDMVDLVGKGLGGYVPLYNYTSGSGVFVENAVIVDNRVELREYALKRDELRQDSAIDYWSVVSFQLLSTN